jgi:hypothetical protein
MPDSGLLIREEFDHAKAKIIVSSPPRSSRPGHPIVSMTITTLAIQIWSMYVRSLALTNCPRRSESAYLANLHGELNVPWCRYQCPA